MKNTIVGTVIGISIAYWAFSIEGIVSIEQAILLTLLGVFTGYGLDRDGLQEMNGTGMKAKDRPIAAIVGVVFGFIFLLASPLFDYGLENWWPIAGAWNLACSVAIFIPAIYMLMKRE